MPVGQTPYFPVVRAQSTDNMFSATALVGVNSLILGWSANDQVDRSKLLGFGIRRSDYDGVSGVLIRSEWFYGNKKFRFQQNAGFGSSIPTYQAPFQRFNWNDYTLEPGKFYKYEIVPFWDDPKNLRASAAVELMVTPSANEVDLFGVYTNRGVTSAHAYLNRFGGQTDPHSDKDAQVWLSRGLKESLLHFIKQAKVGDSLHVAIYEFEDVDVAAALAAARDKGVEVHIVYHAKDEKQKTLNEAMLNAHGLGDPQHSTARDQIINISHNKFVVHLKNGAPKALWTGTCNFTFNGFYLQTNMALEVKHPATAEAYESYFQILKRNQAVNGPNNPVKKEIAALIIHTEQALGQQNWKVNFSPVSQTHLLDISADLIKDAQSAVLVSAPFALDAKLVKALIQNDPKIIEYGLCNTTVKKKIENLNFDNTRFFTPTVLKTYMGQNWDAKAFGSHKIHSKTLVVDPWSERPKVIIGTANFSDESCRENDENFLVIDGDKRLAAIVSTEFIRMWEHYKNRAFINEIMGNTPPTAANILLAENGSWSDREYNEQGSSYKFRERIVFSGGI